MTSRNYNHEQEQSNSTNNDLAAYRDALFSISAAAAISRTSQKDSEVRQELSQLISDLEQQHSLFRSEQ